MIRKLEINNFKSLLSASLQLSNLTVLTGLNSSGKSSVFQALSLLADAGKGDGIDEQFDDFEDLRCRYAEADGGIKISAQFCDNTQLEFTQIRRNDLRNLYQVHRVNIDTGEAVCVVPLDVLAKYPYAPMFDHFYAIVAERFGPRVSLPARKISCPQSVGNNGEHVIQYCMNRGGDQIPKLRRHDLANDITFDYQLEAWMSEICPGVRFHFNVTQQTDTGYYTVGNRIDNTIAERPTNVGFGIGYTLPIVCQLLGSKKNDLIFLENPEAHLHPLGQTRIGDLIACTAKDGVQLIVETHSDHLIDGIRIAVKKKLLSPDDVSIFFFVKNSENISELIPLKVHENGDMSKWPEGFFDQRLKNLSSLVEF